MRALLGYLLFGAGCAAWMLGFLAGWTATDWDIDSMGSELLLSFLGGMLCGAGGYLVLKPKNYFGGYPKMGRLR